MGQGPIGTTIAVSPTGSNVPSKMDAQGALSMGQRHGKYYSAAYGAKAGSPGALFGCANATGVALSAALATTYVGLCLSNPAASGVNLALKRVRGVITVAPAAITALGLIVGYAAGGITVHTTSLDAAIVNQFVGVAAPATAAHVDSACTLVGTPRWDRWFGAGLGATANLAIAEDLDDAVILPPGAYAAIGANIAGPAAGFFGSFEWEELGI